MATPGEGTIVAEAAEGLRTGQPCRLSIRPEKLFIQPTSHAYDNELAARFVARIYVGDFIRYYFRLPDGSEIVVKVLNDLSAPEFSEGQDGRLVWLISDCIAFPKDP